MTHSERKWLMDQMASPRKRPGNPARSRDAGQSHAPETVPPAPAPRGPSADEPSDVADHEWSTVRRVPPAATDSFWSFG